MKTILRVSAPVAAALTLTVILLLGVAAAAAPAAGNASLPAVDSWQQVAGNGFGITSTTAVDAVAAFNGALYAGTTNLAEGAGIYRSVDDLNWTAVISPGFGNPHDTAPPSIRDLTVAGSYLYAATGLGGNGGQIWRTLDGDNWAPVMVHGFADPDNTDIAALVGYSGPLYAGVYNQVTGAEIWRSYTGDSNSWTQVAPAAAGSAPGGVTAFAAFDGALYAAVETEEAPVQIWRSYGSAWTTVISDGFGMATTTLAGGMAVFDGRLYVGTGDTASGAGLWRTVDGSSWEAVIDDAFGDANNARTESVYVFQNALHVTVQNGTTGLELWRSSDGIGWTQVNADGFGDAGNSRSGSQAVDSFGGRLFLGTVNTAAGGELWRMTPAAFRAVALSPDDDGSGLPAAAVTYTLTITNGGTITDTYDLALSGNSWTTTPSTTTIHLAPGAATRFSVTVTIPSAAPAAAGDTTTISASSRAEPSVTAATQLTTTALPSAGMLLGSGQSSSAFATQIVTYSLTITNSGNIADTFNLTIGGHSWPTTLSTTGVPLAPGVASALTVTVAIPLTAPPGAVDVATVTATSTVDSAVSATTVLTTTSNGAAWQIFLPATARAP